VADSRSVLRNPSLQPDRELSAEIQRCAYEIYIQRGQADGYALDDWLSAEKELRTQAHRPQATVVSQSSRIVQPPCFGHEQGARFNASLLDANASGSLREWSSR
jgi:Protein of unknown function (DUF2934)